MRNKPKIANYFTDGNFDQDAYEQALERYEREVEYSPEDERERDRMRYEASTEFQETQVEMQNDTNGKEKS